MNTLNPDMREALAKMLYKNTAPKILEETLARNFRDKLQDAGGSYFWIDRVEEWIVSGGSARRDRVKLEIEHNYKQPTVIYKYLTENVKAK